MGGKDGELGDGEYAGRKNRKYRRGTETGTKLTGDRPSGKALPNGRFLETRALIGELQNTSQPAEGVHLGKS